MELASISPDAGGPNNSDELASSGHAHSGFAASNLIDHVSFTAYWLRGLTGRAGPAAQDRPAGSLASGHR
jgi:hypothetical protein